MLKKSLVAASVAILLMTACASDTVPSTESIPGDSASAVSPPQASTDGKEPPQNLEQTTQGSASKGMQVSNPIGTFLKIALPDDSPAYSVDPETFSADSASGKMLVTDSFTDAEIESGQRRIVDWISTETINSALNNSAALPPEKLAGLRNQWWVDHKAQIDPAMHEKFQASLTSDKPIVMVENWQQDQPTYLYKYGDGEPRIRDLRIQVREVSAVTGRGFLVRTDLAYNTDVILDGKQLASPQQSYGSVSLTVRPDDAAGWLVTGFSNDIITIPASASEGDGDSKADIFADNLR